MSKKISTKEYENWSKEELIKEIVKIKSTTYGLVWHRDLPEEEIDLLINPDARTPSELFSNEVAGKPFPVLKEVKGKAIENNKTSPINLLIQGDNYHSLAVLNFTHQESVDLIYIDPPYNTGSDDFRYNDKRVDAEDPFRHSKWLSFMEKRLKLAKKLLKKTGVIFLSIDDHEQAPLRMLCDEILGEKNFVAQLIWAAGRKNDSKLMSVSHEYILCYVASIDEYKEKKITWRKRKEGIDSIYSTYKRLKKKYKDNFQVMEDDLKQWFADLPASDQAKRHRHYCHVDERGVYFAADISWPGGGGPKYAVLHPETKKPVKIPARGWIFSKSEKMEEMILQNRVRFGADETIVPTMKAYLSDSETEVPYSVFYTDGRAATKRLREILNNDAFENPKDENILAEIIKFAAPKDAVVLDFFAGSGTTGHSVMKLNYQDGGNRRFILCTNNENNICSDVCYPRIKKVINGYKNLKGEEIEGLGGNLKYYTTDFVEAEPTDRNKRKLVKESTEMLCIHENTFVPVLENEDFRVFRNHDKKYVGIIFYEEAIEDYKKAIKKIDGHFNTYVFSLGDDAHEKQFVDIKNKVTLCAIPEVILKVYREIFK